MIKGTKDVLERIATTHVCPEHGPFLCVAWHAQEDSYVIRCGEGHYPEEVTREPTPTQQYKEGTLPAVGKTLDLLQRVDLATGETLSAVMIRALQDYATRYGLDAYRGHVMVMYGKPYIGIDGYLYHAKRSELAYSLRSRALDEQERPGMQIKEGDHAWICRVVFTATGEDFVGYGIVTRDEMTAPSKKDKTKLAAPVVAAHPWQLAQKRAEWQALRRAFPIGETENNEEV